MKYIKSLDGVRALAILLVIIFHYYYLLEVGWVGVQLFFVLSGFLITSILLNDKKYPLGFYLKRFYWRRSLRIFPLYYAYIMFIGIVYLIANLPDSYAENLPWMLTYTFNYVPLFRPREFDIAFVHFWSLAVEEQFYLIWPLIIFLFSNNQLKYVTLIIIVGCPFFRLLAYEWLLQNNYQDIGQTIYRLTPAQLDAFAIGSIIPIFKLSWTNKFTKSVSQFILLLFIGFGVWNMLSLELGYTTLGYPIGSTDNSQHIWSYTLINAGSAILILYLISQEGSKLSQILENRILVEIGKVSYGMYVYHWIILAFFKKIVAPHIESRVISLFLHVLVVYFISYLSFRFFEKYFIDLKSKKFSSKSHES